MTKALTDKEYKDRLKEIHGGDIKSLEEYINKRTKILHKCNICKNKWEAFPSHTIYFKQSGCPKCAIVRVAKSKTKSHYQYQKQLHKKFNYKIKIIEPYTNKRTPILHKCVKHNYEWRVTPNNMLGGTKIGCHRCIEEFKVKTFSLTNKEFMFRLTEVHEDNIIPLESYKNGKQNIWVRCKKCKNKWSAIPASLIGKKRSGCPVCNKPKYSSNIAIEWLEILSKKLRIKIQHGKNTGEFYIPNTRYRVDGYNKRKKIVFEFHGDAYHGNPDIYKPRSKPNYYFPDTTAKQLYKKTIAREQELKELGYKVISIWENDYRNNFEEWLEENLEYIK